jgi:hypothetical protein
LSGYDGVNSRIRQNFIVITDFHNLRKANEIFLWLFFLFLVNFGIHAPPGRQVPRRAGDQVMTPQNNAVIYKGISNNQDFGLSSRRGKILTGGIYVIFRGLKFFSNAEIDPKDNYSRRPKDNIRKSYQADDSGARVSVK